MKLAHGDEVVGNCRNHGVGLGEDIFREPFFKSRADQGDQQKTPNPKKKRFEPFGHRPLELSHSKESLERRDSATGCQFRNFSVDGGSLPVDVLFAGPSGSISGCRRPITPWLRLCGISPHGGGAIEIDGAPDSVAYPPPSRSDTRGVS